MDKLIRFLSELATSREWILGETFLLGFRGRSAVTFVHDLFDCCLSQRDPVVFLLGLGLTQSFVIRLVILGQKACVGFPSIVVGIDMLDLGIQSV